MTHPDRLALDIDWSRYVALNDHGIAGLTSYCGCSSAVAALRWAPGAVNLHLRTMSQADCLAMHKRQHQADVEAALARREAVRAHWTPERRARHRQIMIAVAARQQARREG